MVSKRKKKLSTGEGAQFLSRKTALKKLQLSLKDFRKLCILKGVYPREPNNRKKAQKGGSGIQTLYHKKDIQFLMHEPIIWKFRDLKVYNRKVDRARGMWEHEEVKRLLQKHPTYSLDHIVKERYPTFMDALRDLDDCLTLCFLFSTFPSIKHVARTQSDTCRRLTIEFLHAVIEAKALRKVFVSIKGYYYQAEIKGETITWIVPHHFSFAPQDKSEVDFKIMSTFVEFYTVMLGFANYYLYHSLNLKYPPMLSNYGTNQEDSSLVDEEVFVSERIAALNIPITKIGDSSADDPAQLDQFTLGENENREEAEKELQSLQKLKTLLQGLKFFINREVPREPMVFLIRCFGGLVSWDKLSFVGAAFDESDESITHQIVDRTTVNKEYLSRYYVQPQWVFDSVNARELLPVSKYLMGATLPPHLSPFTNPGKTQEYVPPEIRDPTLLTKEPDEVVDDEDEVEMKLEEADEKNEESAEEQDEKTEESVQEQKKSAMAVKRGEVFREDEFADQRREKQEFNLRERMIEKKHKKLYRSMKEGKKKRMKEIWLLRKKRRTHDENEEKVKKEKKRAVVAAATSAVDV